MDCTEPDKAAMSAYALLELYQATGSQKYLNQSIHTARVLASNMVQGNATSAPWPFRVLSQSGIWFQSKSSNMAFFLRLFYSLSKMGYSEFQAVCL